MLFKSVKNIITFSAIIGGRLPLKIYIVTTFFAIQLCYYNFHNKKIYSNKINEKYSNENMIKL